MHCERVEVWAKLKQIIACHVRDPFWRQDLLQEAILHLWQCENLVPGQTTSWYLQSCRFHVQHMVRAGRSLDAPCRTVLRKDLPPETDDSWNDLLDPSHVDDVVVSAVSAREMMALVARQLTELEKKLLEGLMEGYSTREMAGQLGVSQTWVVKCRHRIACLARAQGLGRPVLI